MSDFELIQGDCLEIMKEMEAGSVDCVLADIPYGTIACSWDEIIPFAPMWENIERLRKERTAVVLFSKQPFTSRLVVSNIKNHKYEWIWEKPKASGYANVGHRPLSAHENPQVFYLHDYYPQMKKGEPYDQPRKKQNYDDTMNGAFKVRSNDYEFKDNVGTRHPRSVIKFRNSYYDDGKQVHPTQKPVSLMEYFILTYSFPGETILDFTMGSGSTGVACGQLGRKFIGIDNDPDYFATAEKRIQTAYAQQVMF